MSILIATDLHLSDRQRDRHRFGIFKWLREQQMKYQTKAVFILGDLTETKDTHNANLVNRIVDNLCSLAPPVFVLKGNHDYIDPSNPFFGFLDYIDGWSGSRISQMEVAICIFHICRPIYLILEA